eukprot:m.180281 g.180281  ORF g.180281 m.180281 type:complete len:562 (+) comp13573_c4_seq6:1790-3475(+)
MFDCIRDDRAMKLLKRSNSLFKAAVDKWMGLNPSTSAINFGTSALSSSFISTYTMSSWGSSTSSSSSSSWSFVPSFLRSLSSSSEKDTDTDTTSNSTSNTDGEMSSFINNAPTDEQHYNSHVLSKYRLEVKNSLEKALALERDSKYTNAISEFRNALRLIAKAKTAKIASNHPHRVELNALRTALIGKTVLINHKIDSLSQRRRSAFTSPRASKKRSVAGSSQRYSSRAPRASNKNSSSNKTTTPTTSSSSATARVEDLKKKTFPGVDKQLAARILDEVMDHDTGVTMDDIIGMEKAKQSLQETVVLPTKRPELFKGLRTPSKGLLLFGPPGNGKTMLAKAVASSSGCTFFNISASALTSKWVGESEKLVRALFAMARELQPAIIFIDEIDSLLKARSDSENESARRLKTEMMVQIDGAGTLKDTNVLVMGATNRPMEIDSAVIRRLPARIYVPLPSLEMRGELVFKLISKVRHKITQEDLLAIARKTEGYSCSDLSAMTKDAVMNPLREVMPQLDRVEEKDIRPVALKDFIAATERVRRSVNNQEIRELETWNRDFGYKT